MTFLNTLQAWQWALLGAIPIAILLLYFLKLRREPIEVPSTFLWRQAIEDLHVNSLWQKLRKSLLLFLQLLLILLLIIALLRPGWKGTAVVGNRLIFLIDTSASMQATDVQPTRLQEAKRRVRALIEEMKSDDVAMLISVSDVAQIEQPYTDSRSLLLRKLERVKATNRLSNLDDALRYAAGLANPGRTSREEDSEDIQVAKAKPATLYIMSDGNVNPVRDFSLGNLTPIYIGIGTETVANRAIATLAADRHPENPNQTQVFGSVQNFGSDPAEIRALLYRDNSLVDAVDLTVDPKGTHGLRFDLPDVEAGVLRLELEQPNDAYLLDDRAWTVLNPPRQARVLLVTPGNESLSLALSTTQAQKVADVSIGDPAILKSKAYQNKAQSGAFDVVIYDQCAPKEMPQANTFFLGRKPQGEQWEAGPVQGPPLIIDSDRAHPIMQYVDLGNIKIAEGFPLTAPAGGTCLIDTDIGCLLSIAPRQGFLDLVLGMEIVGRDDEGAAYANTDWPIRRSFPVFVMNVLRYLGGSQGALMAKPIRPGEQVTLLASNAVDQLQVTSPTGQRRTLQRDGQNAFVYVGTDALGVYEVREGDSDEVAQRFAVNLFNRQESDLAPAAELDIAYNKIKAESSKIIARKELWRWILILAIVVLVFEWYVYNRRVYI